MLGDGGSGTKGEQGDVASTIGFSDVVRRLPYGLSLNLLPLSRSSRGVHVIGCWR